jgi:hypothetical protein
MTIPKTIGHFDTHACMHAMLHWRESPVHECASKPGRGKDANYNLSFKYRVPGLGYSHLREQHTN